MAAGGDLRQAFRDPRPTGFDAVPGIEVAQVVNLQALQELPRLGHGWHDGAQLPELRRRLGSTPAIGGGSVVRDAGHRHVRFFQWRSGEAAPWLQPVEVYRDRRGSGTFRMSSEP